MKIRVPLVLLACMSYAVLTSAEPLAHTYSIVARDPDTGQIGVAVQSHWFSVGSIVAWAEPGVGAVATQSFVDPSYGPLGLELMRAGKSASQALEALLTADEGAAVRQVAMIDATGDRAAHTGEKCIREAGHVVGDNFSAQANLMKRDTVWQAMADAFEASEGDLAERLLAALEAAELEGGDIRGRQSAALIVVDGDRTSTPWSGRIFDLRVDDSDDPVGEMRRLVQLQRAYNHMNRGDELAAEAKWDEAMKEYREGAALAPDIEELPYWVAATLVSAGRVEESLPIFREVFRKNPDWIEVTRRLPDAGLLPDDQELIRKIISAAD